MYICIGVCVFVLLGEVGGLIPSYHRLGPKLERCRYCAWVHGAVFLVKKMLKTELQIFLSARAPCPIPRKVRSSCRDTSYPARHTRNIYLEEMPTLSSARKCGCKSGTKKVAGGPVPRARSSFILVHGIRPSSASSQ